MKPPPADKADIYAQLNLTLTYQPGQRLVEATVKPGLNMRKGFVSEAGVEPIAHRVRSQARIQLTSGTGRLTALAGAGQSGLACRPDYLLPPEFALEDSAIATGRWPTGMDLSRVPVAIWIGVTVPGS